MNFWNAVPGKFTANTMQRREHLAENSAMRVDYTFQNIDWICTAHVQLKYAVALLLHTSEKQQSSATDGIGVLAHVRIRRVRILIMCSKSNILIVFSQHLLNIYWADAYSAHEFILFSKGRRVYTGCLSVSYCVIVILIRLSIVSYPEWKYCSSMTTCQRQLQSTKLGMSF